jgi:UDP-glucose 4-epimerase
LGEPVTSAAIASASSPPPPSPVVLDNLVYGHRAAVPPGVAFYEGDLGDEALVARVLRDEKIEVVMHFAAYCYVGESVTDPLKYYFNNVAATLHLLHAMLGAGVKKFVFSSTCATYGAPAPLPIVRDLSAGAHQSLTARPSSTWKPRSRRSPVRTA